MPRKLQKLWLCEAFFRSKGGAVMLRHVRPGLLAYNVGCILLGLLVLLLPQQMARLLFSCLGFFLAAGGVIHIAGYLRTESPGVSETGRMFSGLALLLFGILWLLRPDPLSSGSFLPPLFAVLILASALMRFQAGRALARAKGQKAWVILLLALVSLGFGLLLCASPLLNRRHVDLVMLSGIFLLAEGIVSLCCTMYTAMEFHALDRVAAALAEQASGKEADTAPEEATPSSDPSPAPTDEESSELPLN